MVPLRSLRFCRPQFPEGARVRGTSGNHSSGPRAAGIRFALPNRNP
ncbi:hypothetical protein [Eastern grey kangaroopox virus]|uniref:Uncharacterized protein n=1 Tax=Eastern grey kangaroopox virus TaxID=2042482 RepID=A0A2C9DSX9_9POXV|nr:hypothetical protein KM541_gp016 [Eastern grey kangaroopox virus]ATI21112.1 hypothetical protein [Eastern grey kangaroopox virus]AXK50161.1 hypothetical protein EKPV-NSW-ORF027 [Eastern grey kangaroopox virus]